MQKKGLSKKKGLPEKKEKSTKSRHRKIKQGARVPKLMHKEWELPGIVEIGGVEIWSWSWIWSWR